MIARIIGFILVIAVLAILLFLTEDQSIPVPQYNSQPISQDSGFKDLKIN